MANAFGRIFGGGASASQQRLARQQEQLVARQEGEAASREALARSEAAERARVTAQRQGARGMETRWHGGLLGMLARRLGAK